MDTTATLLLAATGVSAALYVVMHVAFHLRVARDNRATRIAGTPDETVTILKPLSGCDDELRENLKSFARLPQRNLEILFGVASTADPAYAVASQFVATFPKVNARVVLTRPADALNPKVAQLVGLLREASGSVLIISDSNVRVNDDYVSTLLSELKREKTGLVTSLIIGDGEQTLGAALENLHLTAHVAPGILALDALTSTTISVGKSMAMRRVDLARIGGLYQVANVLAEDHMLGVAFRNAGYKVRVCTAPIQNQNVYTTVARTLERHTRWAKMRRVISGPSFMGEPLLLPMLVATLNLFVAPLPVAACVLAACAILQISFSAWATITLRGRFTPAFVPLEVLRTYLHFFVWLEALRSRHINWRGHEFRLGRDSRLISVRESSKGIPARLRKGVWARLRRVPLSP